MMEELDAIQIAQQDRKACSSCGITSMEIGRTSI